jgi:hypothetical protein
MAVVATHDGHQVFPPFDQGAGVGGYPADQAPVNRIAYGGGTGLAGRIEVNAYVQESPEQPHQQGCTYDFV